jgi:nitrite reductase/ring-hydroxylating ferredoxin subunit
MIMKSIEIAFETVQTRGKPEPTTGKTLLVGPATEIPEGGVKIVTEGASLSIGVFRVGGEFYAVRNFCPHQGAPLCLGRLHTTHAPSEVGVFDPALEGRVLRCPWHGWEFDIQSGKGLYDARGRVKTYATRVDGEGNLWIDF